MPTQLIVQMADHEWSSNVDMQKLAEEQLVLHAGVPDLMVTVYEHAGWYLSYALVDGKPAIVETANDAAAVTPERKRFWEKVKFQKWETLPTIRRPAKTPTCEGE